MLRRSIVAVALMAALMLPIAAQADSAAIKKKLSETPATLWDLSAVRIEAALAAWAGGEGRLTYVSVESDNFVMNIYDPKAKATKAECKKLVDLVKRAGGVDPKTGYADNPASDYAALLNYPQIDQFSVEESYAETADSMFWIMAVAGSGEGAVTCKGPLISTEVSYPTP
jgi:hypothetical protein